MTLTCHVAMKHMYANVCSKGKYVIICFTPPLCHRLMCTTKIQTENSYGVDWPLPLGTSLSCHYLHNPFRVGLSAHL